MLFFKKRTPRAKDINNFKNKNECQLTKQFKTL
jgi:phage FluMu protein Com